MSEGILFLKLQCTECNKITKHFKIGNDWRCEEHEEVNRICTRCGKMYRSTERHTCGKREGNK